MLLETRKPWQQTEKMIFRKNIIAVLILLLLSCSGKKEKKPMLTNTKVNNEQIVDSAKIDLSEVDSPEKVRNSSFDKIINAIELKKTPLIDSTNFDNFNKTNFFNKLEISILKIERIYPQFYKEGHNYKTTSSYKIEFSEKFHSIVLTTFKGDHEMESALINYDLDGKLIDFKVISYDEIAEGWSQIVSKIEKNKLTITNILWLDEKQEEIEIFEINAAGKIKPAIFFQKFTAGLIKPNKEFKLCCIYIPNSGLKIYDQPNGNPQGKIYLDKSDNNKEFYSAHIEKNGFGENLESTNFEMVGYEIMALVFVDSKSEFVKLNNGYWLSVEELKSKNLKLTSWMDYVVEKNTEWYANEPGLNLREGPSADQNKIVTLKGDVFGITLTTEKKGKWCKVKVKKYRKNPCSGEDNLILKTYTGWIKFISEEETPNVWNYSKGC